MPLLDCVWHPYTWLNWHPLVQPELSVSIRLLQQTHVKSDPHPNNSGVLIQFGIVVGIMITQAMGLRLATPTEWRLVLIFSSVLSLGQLFMSAIMTESPHWFDRHGLFSDKDAVIRRIWKSSRITRDVERKLFSIIFLTYS